MKLPSFPKILALGSLPITYIFNGRVEVTEKIDGSQFSFGVFDGDLICRSKGAELVLDAPESLFRPAVEYLLSIKHRLPEGLLFFGETLKSPKHNVIKYDRIPDNHIMLFGLWDKHRFRPYHEIEIYADKFELEMVPLIENNVQIDYNYVLPMLGMESVLGGSKIEGVVVKNYEQPYMLTRDVFVPFMLGKFVSEKFKEAHAGKAYGKRESKQNLDEYFQQFRAEARWHKAIQHLAEAGKFSADVKSIGPVLHEIHRDLMEEEKESIKDRLWKEYEKQILRTATAGFPEWFKEQLARGEFNIGE